MRSTRRAGPLTGIRVHRAAEHRPDAVRGHVARRPGRRGAAPRPGDASRERAAGRSPASSRPTPSSTAAGAAIGIDLKHPDGRRGRARARASSADVLHRGLPARRRRAARRRARRRASPATRAWSTARMTGWGQDGPLADDVGHDINYISLAGVLVAHRAPRAVRPSRRSTSSATSAAAAPRSCMGILAALRRARDARARVRWSTRRWSTAARMLMSIFVGLDAMGVLVRRPRHEPARRRRALLQRVRDGRRRVRLDRELRAEVLRRAASRCSVPLGIRRLDPATQMDQAHVARR